MNEREEERERGFPSLRGAKLLVKNKTVNMNYADVSKKLIESDDHKLKR